MLVNDVNHISWNLIKVKVKNSREMRRKKCSIKCKQVRSYQLSTQACKRKLLKKLSSFCGEGTPYNQASTSSFFLLIKERGLLSQAPCFFLLMMERGLLHFFLLIEERGLLHTILLMWRGYSFTKSFCCGEDTPYNSY